MIEDIKKLLREGLVETTNECDCCGYFDMTSLNAYGFDKPLYHLLEKFKTFELRFIPPKQYIYAIARGFGGLTYDDAISGVEPDLIDKYAEAMRRGEKFPIGYYNDGSSPQEGRHRALAAMKLGCNSIPVVRVEELDSKRVMDFVEEHKHFTIEDFNEKYSQYPYSGVTQLGYNSFKRKLELLKK